MSSASGKVILAGEHAVVYGSPALALGLPMGVEAEAVRADTSQLYFGSQRSSDDETASAFTALLAQLHAPPMSVRVEMKMPHGVGLGASAAVAVAIARAIDAAANPTPSSDDTILEAANAWEGVFHGNPSGIDTACALHGGCIRFQRGQRWRRIHLQRAFVLGVAVAGPPSATKDMVASVARIRERNPKGFDDNLKAIESLVKNTEQCLTSGDLPGLGKLLDYNHMLLASWHLSTPEIEQAVRVARSAGALGAKLTGAGGGGCVIAVIPEGIESDVVAAWQGLALECFTTRVGPL